MGHASVFIPLLKGRQKTKNAAWGISSNRILFKQQMLLLKPAAKWQKCQLRQLEMLHAKGDAHNGHTEEEPYAKVKQAEFPSEKDEPQDVAQQATGTKVTDFYFSAKWREGESCYFKALHTEGDADDRDAQEHPGNGPSNGAYQAAEQYPYKISE